MNYKPHILSWMNVRKNLRTVGLIMPDITNAFYPTVIRGLEFELFRNDYTLMLQKKIAMLTRQALPYTFGTLYG